MMAETEDCVIVVDEGEPSNMDEWFDLIMKAGSEQENSQSHDKPWIQRVPKMLREIDLNKKCYEPLVVSIGPYHHGNPDLELVEKLKILTARQFVIDSRKTIKQLYSKVEACNAREFYEDSIVAFNGDEEFARMMFLDACFVLHFIDCVVNKKYHELKMKNDHTAFVSRDLFLLENQLPFIVLKELMSLRFTENEWKDLIIKFIKLQVRISECFPWEEDKQPLHLLDLLRTKLLREVHETPNENCIHLFSRPRTKLPGDGTASSKDRDWHSFRSVNELRTAGIKCKRSQTNSLENIRFKSGIFYGYLSLPAIVIDDSTKSKLLNLVAYEACSGVPYDFAVTSFICFMDSLIDNAADVKELRSKGILLNVLGSDEQVADLFNELTIDLVPNPSHYQKVKDSIEEHYTKKRRIWMAEMLHTHFNSPWTAIGFFAAVLAVLLSSTQTIFTIFPR